MSSKTVYNPSDEDVSLEGPDGPCDLNDSTYSVLGSFIVDKNGDKNEGVEEVRNDKDQPEEDDGVDVIDEESVSTEDQPITTQIAESDDSGKSSSSSDTTAKKVGLPKKVAHASLNMKMNLVFFIIITILVAGYIQYHIDLKQEQKLESVRSQLQQFQHGGKNGEDLCPVFVEIMQIAKLLIQTGGVSDVIQTCGKVISECLEDGKVKIGLFLESDGLHLIQSVSAQKKQNLNHWMNVLKLAFDRRNEVDCNKEYVVHLLQLIDLDSHKQSIVHYASGIFCKCLVYLWDADTDDAKHQVSEAVSKAIETIGRNFIFTVGHNLRYKNMDFLATFAKKSSVTARQHSAVWALSCKIHHGVSDRRIKYLIGRMIIDEILRDSQVDEGTKFGFKQYYPSERHLSPYTL